MKEYRFKINGNPYEVCVDKIENGTATVLVNGAEYSVEIEGQAKAVPAVKAPAAPAAVQAAAPAAAAAPKAAPAAGDGAPVKSPLPGVILDVAVKVGDSVKVGDRLVVLEAMKMENNIDSDRAGVVKSIAVNRGDSVLEGDVLLTIA